MIPWFQIRMDLRRGAGFWTLAKHISHLAQVQSMLLKRLERFMNEEHPEFVPYITYMANKEPDSPQCINIASSLDQFKYLRDKQLRILETADDVM
jgi:hypothetical protein